VQECVKFTYQTTFTIEKEIAERAFLFAECVGTFPANGRNNQLFNSGAQATAWTKNSRSISILISASIARHPLMSSASAIRSGWTAFFAAVADTSILA
jgi:hypothetical protein